MCTAHPSTASVPITVLLYDGPLLCGFNVAIKGLKVMRLHLQNVHKVKKQQITTNNENRLLCHGINKPPSKL